MPRAVVFDEFGGIDVLHLAEVDSLVPGLGQVAVCVKAAGLNPFDYKLRMGVTPMPVEFPRCTGSDFSGVVTEVGPDALYFDGTPVAVGDEVLGSSEVGSLREQAVVSAGAIVRKPDLMSFELAGGLAVVCFTAQACMDLMKPKAGDTVIVGAAAGAVGMIFAQLAIDAGARVIGTASQANHDFLRSLGVEPVPYGPGLVDRLRALTPDGITFVQDNWGREFIDVALELGVAPNKICTIVDHAATAELGLSNPGRYDRPASTLAALASRIATGDIVLPIERVFPLDDFADAFRLLEGRHLRGKIIVTP